jgi:hypothetical protein
VPNFCGKFGILFACKKIENRKTHCNFGIKQQRVHEFKQQFQTSLRTTYLKNLVSAIYFLLEYIESNPPENHNSLFNTIYLQRNMKFLVILSVAAIIACDGFSHPHKVLKVRGGGMSMVADGIPELKPPKSLYDGAVAAGAMKAASPPLKIFILGILSGCHIAFGGYLMMAVGGACPGLAASNPGLQKLVLGAFGLPFGKKNLS